MNLYAITILLGAFLLFQVQPLIGKMILPWFGGTPAVWTTCMLFFQVALLAGYAYAHVLGTKARHRIQIPATVLILFAAALMLPIIPGEGWKSHDTANPTWRILLLLGATVGLPFFVLATTSPLLQKWYSLTHPGKSPYRFYAVSNIGSLAALVTYPVLVEPLMSSRTQARVWSVGFVILAVLYAATAIQMCRRRPVAAPLPDAGDDTEPSPTIFVRILWVLLAATGSTMLLAVTNRMCQDVSVIPFLWALPLAIYLGTFVACFDHDRWRRRRLFWPALALCSAWMCWVLFQGALASIVQQVSAYSIGLFVCCMALHGELVGLKPSPRRLTEFYLSIAFGGALGGVFVALVAPLFFDSFFELNLAIGLCPILVALAFWQGSERQSLLHTRREKKIFIAAAIVLSLGLWIALGFHARRETRGYTECARNFYGVLAVGEYKIPKTGEGYTMLIHGRISHGMQFKSPEKRRKATSYFGPKSGIGLTLTHFPSKESGLKIGVAGLGTGTLAAYGREGDAYRFYEINPNVARLAKKYFTFLDDCRATTAIVMGDARLSLEREAPQGFDVLILDAFTGDAIPTHLLTVEAFDIYRRHLKPGGVIAVNASNRHLDLYPVVSGLARHFDMATAYIVSAPDEEMGIDYCTWILMSANEDFMALPEIHTAATSGPPSHIRLWTDSYSNLFTILKF